MIRDAVSADEPVLETIQHDALVSPWPELLETAVRAQALGGPRCLVATPSASNTPVGYVLAVEGSPEPEQDAHSHEPDGVESRCYVAEIAVAAEHRREGYGSALLEAIAERSDAEELFLTARADEALTHAFYNANGFRVADRIPDHYDGDDGPQDGLLFSKRVRDRDHELD